MRLRLEKLDDPTLISCPSKRKWYITYQDYLKEMKKSRDLENISVDLFIREIFHTNICLLDEKEMHKLRHGIKYALQYFYSKWNHDITYFPFGEIHHFSIYFPDSIKSFTDNIVCGFLDNGGFYYYD